MRVPAHLLLIIDFLLPLIILAHVLYPFLSILGYLDFHLTSWALSFLFFGASWFAYPFVQDRFLDIETKKEYCFMQYSFMRFLYPNIGRFRPLPDEHIIIPQTLCFMSMSGLIIGRYQVANITVTDKRLVAERMIPPDSSYIFGKIVIWFPGADAGPGKDAPLFRFLAADVSKYSVSIAEDGAGKYVCFTIPMIVSGTQICLYHPQSSKIYDMICRLER